jgi:hypothetical protein
MGYDVHIQWDIIQSQKGRNSDTHCNTDEPKDTMHAKWNNQTQKGQLSYNSTYTRHIEEENLCRQKAERQSPGASDSNGQLS